MPNLRSNYECLNEVKAVAAELATDEQSVNTICPFCDGGKSQERSFSVMRTVDGAAYCCHRDSCNKKGFVQMMISSANATSTPRLEKFYHESPMRKLNFMNLSDETLALLYKKWHLTAKDCKEGGIQWIRDLQRLCVPIRTIRGYPVGIVARSIDPKVTPKSLIYVTNMTEDGILAAFYMNDPKKGRIWIVEDQISALRISQHENAVALLGTNLSERLALNLKQASMSNIVLCLDKDAQKTAQSLYAKYSGTFNHMSIRVPPKDPKDMDPKDLKEFIESRAQ